MYETVVAGLGFLEGPLWTSRGELMFVSVSRGLIYAVADGGDVRTAGDAGGTPTGLAEGPDGAVWIAQGGRSGRGSSHAAPPCIQRLRGDEIEIVHGSGLVGPNDCVVGPDGRLWFTDPVGPPLDGDTPPGRVCVLDPASGELSVFAGGILYPNGLAFSPARDALYVAETRVGRILRFDLARPEAATVFATVEAGHPDGLAVDSEGSLYVAAFGSNRVEIFDADGGRKAPIVLPEDLSATNLCFGGAEMRTLFLTIPRGGQVLAVEVQVPGERLLRVA